MRSTPIRLGRLLPFAIAACCAAARWSAHPQTALAWFLDERRRVARDPAQYNKVGVIKVGPRTAKNVLVLEPGTSAGGAYFVPLAKWIVPRLQGWQVWSVERRENLLEDQSVLNQAKTGRSA